MATSESILTLPAITTGKVLPVWVRSNLGQEEHQQFEMAVANAYHTLSDEAKSKLNLGNLFELTGIEEVSSESASKNKDILVIEASFNNQEVQGRGEKQHPTQTQFTEKVPQHQLKTAIQKQLRKVSLELEAQSQFESAQRIKKESKLAKTEMERFYIRAYVEKTVIEAQPIMEFGDNAESGFWQSLPAMTKKLVKDVWDLVAPSPVYADVEPPVDMQNPSAQAQNEKAEGVDATQTPPSAGKGVSINVMPITSPAKSQQSVTKGHAAPQSTPHVKAESKVKHPSESIVHDAHLPVKSTSRTHTQSHKSANKESLAMQTSEIPSNISLNIATSKSQSANRAEQITNIQYEENLPDKIVRIESFKKEAVYEKKAPNEELPKTHIESSEGRITHIKNEKNPPYKPVVALDDLPESEQKKVLKHYQSALEKASTHDLNRTFKDLAEDIHKSATPVLLEDQLKALNLHISKEPKNPSLQIILDKVRENVEVVRSGHKQTCIQLPNNISDSKDEPSQ